MGVYPPIVRTLRRAACSTGAYGSLSRFDAFPAMMVRSQALVRENKSSVCFSK